MRDVLRRLYRDLGGNPTEIDGNSLKVATLMVNTRFVLFGIPGGLSADEIAQVERDSLELANCAEWDAGPPNGTDYKLIVLMHDVGTAIHKVAVTY